jgi:hypothetical protein
MQADTVVRYHSKTMATSTRSCPGCGLTAPQSELSYDRKFNASPECWSLFETVIAAEFQDAVLFGRAHQLTVDAYAVQHAGGRHPDKSVDIHLVGLHLVFDKGVAPTEVPRRLQKLAGLVVAWPHFETPSGRSALTVGDVANAGGQFETHARLVQAWASEVWSNWRHHHPAVRLLAKDL